MTRCVANMVLPAQVKMNEPLRLGSNEVHVWWADLDANVSRYAGLRHILAADERARADRYRFQQDRQRYTVGRGLLRTILGGYLGMEPGYLRFRYSPFGKPALVPAPGGDTLNFNVSHADGLALFAITRHRQIGVDVERIRTDFVCEPVAEHFFSARERAALRAVPPEMKYMAFFACWTRKEAYVKARGEGLSLPLDQFDVSLIPGEPAITLNASGAPEEASRWLLHELRPAPGYIAALAAEGRDWRLHCRQWLE
ncbi:MAG: 4'-phosphopantetheinyl transferase family protein [Anaerolineae bacterium]